MKSVYKIIGIIAFAIYLLLLVYIGYKLLLDDTLTQKIYTVAPEAAQLFIAMIAVSFLGLLFSLLGANDNVDVIYVKPPESGSSSTTQNHVQNNHQSNHQGDYVSETLNSSASVRIIEEVILSNQFNKKQLLEKLLQKICDQVEAAVGAIYITKLIEETRKLEMVVSYAYYHSQEQVPNYEFGQGLVGQVAKNAKPIILNAVPKGYIEVVSGLGTASPSHLVIFPVKNEEEEVLGVIEIASFRNFNEKDHLFLRDVALLLAKEIETNEYYNLSL